MILNWNDNFKNGNYHPNLIKNQNIFTTLYDIFESIIHIVLGNSSYVNSKKKSEKEGLSMLEKINIEDRYYGN